MPQEYCESDDDNDHDNQIAWYNSISTMAAFEEHSSDSEDSAPEVVSNSVAKSNALDHIHRAVDTIKQQKELLKEKRRRRDNELVQQKKAKKQRLDDLGSKRLPDHLLAHIHPVEKHQTQDDDQSKVVEVVKTSSKPRKQSKPKSNTEDVIQISTTSTEFRVKALNKQSNSVVANSTQLKQMKMKYLQGKNKRETSTKALAKLGKQAAVGINKF